MAEVEEGIEVLEEENETVTLSAEEVAELNGDLCGDMRGE